MPAGPAAAQPKRCEQIALRATQPSARPQKRGSTRGRPRGDVDRPVQTAGVERTADGGNRGRSDRRHRAAGDACPGTARRHGRDRSSPGRRSLATRKTRPSSDPGHCTRSCFRSPASAGPPTPPDRRDLPQSQRRYAVAPATMREGCDVQFADALGLERFRSGISTETAVGAPGGRVTGEGHGQASGDAHRQSGLGQQPRTARGEEELPARAVPTAPRGRLRGPRASSTGWRRRAHEEQRDPGAGQRDQQHQRQPSSTSYLRVRHTGIRWATTVAINTFRYRGPLWAMSRPLRVRRRAPPPLAVG